MPTRSKPVPSGYDYQHDSRAWDLQCRYGPESMAALARRIRDIHNDPNDRLAYISPPELGSLLRRLACEELSPEVLSYACDVLEGIAPTPKGRESYYNAAAFKDGYAKYKWLRAHLVRVKREGKLDTWLAHQDLQSHSSPSEAAAEYVARASFPGLTGAALRNRFSSIARAIR